MAFGQSIEYFSYIWIYQNGLICTVSGNRPDTEFDTPDIRLDVQ